MFLALRFTLGLMALATLTVRADWPDYRGPWHTGQVNAPGDTHQIGLPWQWSETENVKWKTPVHDRGWSTPGILGQQIWITTATTNGEDFFALCLDLDTGKVLFDERLFHSAHPEPLGNAMNAYASPSPVLESGRAYLSFGSYGTACLDTRTFKVLWKRDDLPCRHFRGPGSSPVLFQDLLILTMDGIDQQYLVALDKRTGKTIWRTDRTAEWNDLDSNGKPRGDGDFRKGFSTPLIVELAEKPVMFDLGSKAAYAHDPLTGRELWRVNHNGHSGAARPLYDRGLVFFCTGHGGGETVALKLQPDGNLAGSNFVWHVARGTPRLPSPVLVDDLMFELSENGIATCLETATGNVVWQERVGGDYAASLILGDGRLYCLSQDGRATVLKAGRTYEVLATSKLEDGFMASPAVAGKALILRTKSAVYRIETTAATPDVK